MLALCFFLVDYDAGLITQIKPKSVIKKVVFVVVFITT